MVFAPIAAGSAISEPLLGVLRTPDGPHEQRINKPCANPVAHPDVSKTRDRISRMQHPERARVIVTRIEDDGSSDYREHTADATVEHDGAGNAVYMATQLWGTA